jgi:hypothetical protein
MGRRAYRYSPSERALRGRIGAHLLHATHNPRRITARAREEFLKGFERAVDPDGTLPDDERRRRASHARAAHFARLARQSVLARARRKRRGRRGGG